MFHVTHLATLDRDETGTEQQEAVQFVRYVPFINHSYVIVQSSDNMLHKVHVSKIQKIQELAPDGSMPVGYRVAQGRPDDGVQTPWGFYTGD